MTADILFRGTALPLEADGLQAALDLLGVHSSDFWAVLQVETAGCGFLPDRRPRILFERQVFHQLTHGDFDRDPAGISDASPGGFGARGAAQYDRLQAAMSCNRKAALKSVSWGLGQVTGYHAGHLGYQDVDDMVRRMLVSEGEHLTAMARFIRDAGLAGALRTHDWARFAHGYIGAGYRIDNYDTRLAAAHAAMERGGLPDLAVRAGQIYLTYLGHDPHGVDGVMGRLTRSAMHEFQAKEGLPLTDVVDEPTLAALASAALN